MPSIGAVCFGWSPSAPGRLCRCCCAAACCGCRSSTDLVLASNLISDEYRSGAHKAMLFRDVVNVDRGEVHERAMTSGMHSIQTVFCGQCATEIGWTYTHAQDPENQHKVGCFILVQPDIRAQRREAPVPAAATRKRSRRQAEGERAHLQEQASAPPLPPFDPRNFPILPPPPRSSHPMAAVRAAERAARVASQAARDALAAQGHAGLGLGSQGQGAAAAAAPGGVSNINMGEEFDYMEDDFGEDDDDDDDEEDDEDEDEAALAAAAAWAGGSGGGALGIGGASRGAPAASSSASHPLRAARDSMHESMLQRLSALRRIFHGIEAQAPAAAAASQAQTIPAPARLPRFQLPLSAMQQQQPAAAGQPSAASAGARPARSAASFRLLFGLPRSAAAGDPSPPPPPPPLRRDQP